MKTKVAVVELHFLPCLAYWKLFIDYDEIWLEACENYQKQSYRNRCYLLTSQGVDRLTVPVLKGRSKDKQAIRRVKIDYRPNWQQQLWRTIQSAYAKAPFFEFYADSIQKVLFEPYEYLFDLNKKLLAVCIHHLGMEAKICQTDIYKKSYPDDIADYRGHIVPKYRTGTIHVNRYIQLFSDAFEQNLSVLDLLFCIGPEAKSIIKGARYIH